MFGSYGMVNSGDQGDSDDSDYYGGQNYGSPEESKGESDWNWETDSDGGNENVEHAGNKKCSAVRKIYFNI